MKFTVLMHDFRVWLTHSRFCIICGHKRHNWRHWKRKETKETEVIPIPDFAKTVNGTKGKVTEDDG